MAKQVIIVLHADGRIEADLKGYQGKECEQEELIKALEELLVDGGKEHKKPEYYQVRQQQVRQGGG